MSDFDSDEDLDIDDQLLFKDGARLKAQRKTLDELIYPVSSSITINGELKKLEYLTSFLGASSSLTNKCLRIVGFTTWIFCLAVQFFYDIYEAITKYGYTFLCAQSIWFLSLIMSTIGTSWRTLPWLSKGLEELRKEGCYEKSVTKTIRILKFFPYIAIIIGAISSGIQMALPHMDTVPLHMDFGLNIHVAVKCALYGIRYVTGCIVYTGFILYWMIPTVIMGMTGYSMAEFMDQMSVKMKDRHKTLTFKEAISAYSKRANFVKTSSNQSFIVLSILLFISVLCFGLNAYVFLFGHRHYLYLWHSLLPPFLMIYPLCTAAWVTKQYSWFIIVVVRAWVIDNLDESENETTDEEAENEKREINSAESWAEESPLNIMSMLTEVPGLGDIEANGRPRVDTMPHTNGGTGNKRSSPFSRFSFTKKRSATVPKQKSLRDSVQQKLSEDDERDELPLWQLREKNPSLPKTEDPEPKIKASDRFRSAAQAVRAVNKFKKSTKKNMFNFEKFLSYLESMRSVVGFKILGVIVTWDLVSTTMFLLFSIIAVFVQESIFGTKKGIPMSTTPMS